MLCEHDKSKTINKKMRAGAHRQHQKRKRRKRKGGLLIRLQGISGAAKGAAKGPPRHKVVALAYEGQRARSAFQQYKKKRSDQQKIKGG